MTEHVRENESKKNVKTRTAERNQRQEVVESHDCQSSQRIRHVKKIVWIGIGLLTKSGSKLATKVRKALKSNLTVLQSQLSTGFSKETARKMDACQVDFDNYNFARGWQYK